jgi:hypothetical protein
VEQVQPPPPESDSPIAKIMVVVLIFALVVVGTAFAILKATKKSAHWDFESIYSTPPDDALKVLWVGNSHMWWWDMPVEMQKTVPNGTRPMWFELVAYPGVPLGYHITQGEARATLNSGEWDVLLLQPQSIEAAVSPERTKMALHRWEEIAEESGVEVVVWAPWGRDPNNDGYGVYQDEWSGGSLDKLTDKMETTLNDGATAARVCPIGAAWLHTHRKHPKAPLWSPKRGNHASQLGTYLTNAMLYACIWRNDPRDISYVPPGISPENAESLRVAAWETAVEKGILQK